MQLTVILTFLKMLILRLGIIQTIALHNSIYIMFCKDWAQGQGFQMGDNFLKWKAGDVFHWNYRNVPHGTCNFGYETNFVFVITGNRKGK